MSKPEKENETTVTAGNAGTPKGKSDDRKFAPFKLTFTDPWAEDEEKREVEMSFRFAKPTKTQIKRMQDTAGRNGAQAMRDIVLGTIHPEDKDALLAKIEEYPGATTSFSSALLKAVGISTDLGN